MGHPRLPLRSDAGWGKFAWLIDARTYARVQLTTTQRGRHHARVNSAPSCPCSASPARSRHPGNVRLCVRLCPAGSRVPRQCEGVALNRASLQSRSPTLAPTRPNARPASPALPAHDMRPTAALLRTPIPALPHGVGYPSLRAKGRSTPLLRRPNPSILRRPAGRHAVGRPVGQMRSYIRGRISDASPAKSLQTSSQRRGNPPRPKRSSGGLLRS